MSADNINLINEKTTSLCLCVERSCPVAETDTSEQGPSNCTTCGKHKLYLYALSDGSVI